MANKRVRAEREREMKLKAYAERLKKTGKYHKIVLILIPFLLLCYFFNWAYVYNTRVGVGTEVKVSGWSFIIAALTRTYSSGDAVYGDLAIPFFYYAKNWCEKLGVLTLISLCVAVCTAVAELLVVFKKKYKLTFVSCALQVAQVVLLFICNKIAIDMNDSDIIPIFCSGVAECSVKSAIYVSIIVALVGAACSILSLAKTIIAGKVE